MSQNVASSDAKTRLFHSYVIIVSLALVMIAGGISRSAFGVFFNPMADALGWSAAQISGTFTFSMIIEGIISMVSGSLSDKFGTRIVITIGGLLAAAGFVLMSQVHNLWQMYIIYGFAMGIGLGGLTVPAISLIAKRFKSHRSAMTGVALASYGVGQLTSPLLSHSLITAYDWRVSYIILGLLLIVLVVIPAQFLKRPRPENEPTLPVNPALPQTEIKPGTVNYSFKEARQTLTFWTIIAAFGLAGFCYTGMIVHLAPFAISIGIPAATAANILACYGGSIICGRLVLGSLADKIGNKRMIIIGLTIGVAAVLWLIQAKTVWAIVLFAIVGGLGLGGITPSLSPLTAKFFGLKYHGANFGAVGGGSVVIGATGPFVLGFLFDISGHYQLPFIVCACLCIVALVACLLLRPPRRPPVKNNHD